MTLGSVLVMMAVNAGWNYVFFRAQDLRASFIVNVAYNLLAVVVFVLLASSARRIAAVFLPYLLYLTYATGWMHQLWRANPGKGAERRGAPGNRPEWMSRGGMVRLLERRFRVKVPLERAWAHLEKVEQWPSWARHIRRIDLHPAGPLNPSSQGTIHLTNGVRSTFRMEELNAGTNWKWAGQFLWITVHYDHQFNRTGPQETEVGFVLDGEGFGAAVFGRLFAAIYARNLDRAIPNLATQFEHA